jgi:hypothetical protein
MVGITPFSDVGYDFSSHETDKNIIGNTGNITYDSYGTGSIYQVFAGAAVTLWKKLSLGAEFIYYFGNLDKVTRMDYSNSSYRSINSGTDISVNATTGKFGLQYEQKIAGDVSMILGATYKLGTSVKGYSTDYKFATQSSISDTLSFKVDTLAANGIRFADEIGVGLSLKGGEKWSAEFNYLRSDWSNCGFDSQAGLASVGQSSFSATVSHSFRVGFEITPNRNDIRYYMRRCSYRAGAYYDRAYYKFDGHNVNSMGLTFGLTLPIPKYYNGVSLGVDLGQRASTRNNMIRERYAMFVIGFNIHDIWFRKNQYQ